MSTNLPSPLSLRFDATDLRVVEPAESDWAQNLTGTIVSTDINDNFREHILGKFELTVINVAGAVDAGVSLAALWDDTQALTDLWSALYRNDMRQLKAKVQQACGVEPQVRHANCVSFDRMMIYPQYRGKGVGLRALRTLVAHFWGREIALFALIPSPLQCTSGQYLSPDEQAEYRSFGLHELPQDKPTGVARLRAYWAQAGFVQVPGTPYMVASAAAPADVCAWWAGGGRQD